MSETSSMREFSLIFRGDDESVVVAHTDNDTHVHSDLAAPETGSVGWSRPYDYNDAVEVADIEEVEALAQDGAFTELRELHSFGHSARLYFHGAELKFYAAPYMDDLLWRALKSADAEAAERAFDEFALQVNQRARSEVRRVQLDDTNMQLQHVIAESQARAERLRANIQRNAAKKQRAVEREGDLRNHIKQLEATRVQAQLSANRIFRQIGQLHSTCAAQLPRNRGLLIGLRKK